MCYNVFYRAIIKKSNRNWNVSVRQVAGVFKSKGHTAALLAIGSWSSDMETMEARWPNSALQAVSASCQFFASLKILHICLCSVPQSNQLVFPLPVSTDKKTQPSMNVFHLENISQDDWYFRIWPIPVTMGVSTLVSALIMEHSYIYTYTPLLPIIFCAILCCHSLGTYNFKCITAKF